MTYDFTEGNITRKLLLFSVPLIIGNMLQQLYNIADTAIVGRYLGEQALAAVGTAYSLMTFLTSVFIGLCMGSGAYFSMLYGKRDMERLKTSVFVAFVTIGLLTLAVNIFVFLAMNPIMRFLRIPENVWQDFKAYISVILLGMMAVFLYNFFANLLRALGNSVVPLIFLGISSVLNVALDICFILVLKQGVAGAAVATVISQYFSAAGMVLYYLKCCRKLRPGRRQMHFDRDILREISSLSVLTCAQQSIMNFGILMVQGLVNSFGTTVMAAFTTAVKIDAFAYAPVQDFGNAFSTFVAQNHGAEKKERIGRGIRSAGTLAVVFCVCISVVVFAGAPKLMELFISPDETEVIRIGVEYLRIEGACYVGIGILFLLYGLYRGINRPAISVVLTVISLGTRVVLAYVLAAVPFIGVTGIWLAIPIGWLLADVTGIVYWFLQKEKKG